MCRMFKWLPVYNYLVMVATLLYQAPFERLLGPWSHEMDRQVPSSKPRLPPGRPPTGARAWGTVLPFIQTVSVLSKPHLLVLAA